MDVSGQHALRRVDARERIGGSKAIARQATQSIRPDAAAFAKGLVIGLPVSLIMWAVTWQLGTLAVHAIRSLF